jgi:hypothetical protein
MHRPSFLEGKEIMTTPWIFQTPPWMFQTHLADAKIKQCVAALQTIADQETDLDVLAPEQALAKLRDVIIIARRALERQGLAGSAWDWVADLEFRPQNK